MKESRQLHTPAALPSGKRLGGGGPESFRTLRGKYTSLALRSRYSDWLRGRRPRGRSSSPGGEKDFSTLQVVRTGRGAHPVS
jgi:hypothetical protein